jgi:hypothetical protein
MSGLVPEFTMDDIRRRTDEFNRERIKKMFEVLSYIGIQCVNYAKNQVPLGTREKPAPGGGFWDRTGNLRSAIGYAVIYDGKVQREEFEKVKDGEEGISAGKKLIEELSRKYNKGMNLVVVAGMEYAAAVESKRYDVITGSSYKGNELVDYMKKELGAVIS